MKMEKIIVNSECRKTHEKLTRFNVNITDSVCGWKNKRMRVVKVVMLKTNDTGNLVRNYLTTSNCMIGITLGSGFTTSRIKNKSDNITVAAWVPCVNGEKVIWTNKSNDWIKNANFNSIYVSFVNDKGEYIDENTLKSVYDKIVIEIDIDGEE